ncbi:MAG: DUF4293 family protein [Bacteroidota bacterium]
MIQRIQTVFLFLAVGTTFAAFFTPIYDRAREDPQVWIGYGFASFLTLAMLVSIAAIFQYKDRKSQVKWVKLGQIGQLIGVGFGLGILFSLGGIGTYLWDEALGLGLVILGLLGQQLAVRSIKKDEELVRSMDRIR